MSVMSEQVSKRDRIAVCSRTLRTAQLSPVVLCGFNAFVTGNGQRGKEEGSLMGDG